jgi:hypothetical protein
MLSSDFLYQQNELLVALLFFIGLIAASEAGYWLGRRRAARASTATKAGAHAATNAQASAATTAHINAVQTAVFALLGLLLAFTLSMAVTRFDSRKQVLLQETNALGTAYLRTQLLPEPQRTATVDLLRRYVDARLASARPNWFQDVPLRNTTSALQQQLWSQAVAAAHQDPRSIPTGLYVQSLNDAIDAQGIRDSTRLNTLPTTELFLLFAVSLLGMGIHGYAAGLGGGRSVGGTILLALLIAVVVTIIIDIDHPYQGLITISQQGMLQLRQSMGNGPPRP